MDHTSFLFLLSSPYILCYLLPTPIADAIYSRCHPLPSPSSPPPSARASRSGNGVELMSTKATAWAKLVAGVAPLTRRPQLQRWRAPEQRATALLAVAWGHGHRPTATYRVEGKGGLVEVESRGGVAWPEYQTPLVAPHVSGDREGKRCKRGTELEREVGFWLGGGGRGVGEGRQRLAMIWA